MSYWMLVSFSWHDQRNITATICYLYVSSCYLCFYLPLFTQCYLNVSFLQYVSICYMCLCFMYVTGCYLCVCFCVCKSLTLDESGCLIYYLYTPVVLLLFLPSLETLHSPFLLSLAFFNSFSPNHLLIYLISQAIVTLN